MPKLLNPETVADDLGLSPQWVRKLLNTGKIEGQKLGKNWVITETALESYKKLRAREAKSGGRSKPRK
jgi:DNA (cytosine-5)-methyltransferase 1